MAHRTTTSRVSHAIKAATTSHVMPPEASAANVAYDAKTRSWSAWYVNDNFGQVRYGGQGRDPMAAVEVMIANNSHNHE